ncbi:MAG: hypothetical protein AVDCRST_MAG91-849 [uncultured Sphingomonadaceae bacterium]|uniref:Uncharacterized protein n=1 Tax=uncultured Sphingomonadaceae bacterium TaxID=169976 RepID=A0A6J4SMP8_9SPHN|nr:MAG: hypothetical protein AVDCRST_MAG91-849 [uncultured Sphingomonadaceae bacterium]
MARRNSNAGGVFVAGGSILGAAVGSLFGMSTFGLLVGLATGVIVALLIWLRNRRADSGRIDPPR